MSFFVCSLEDSLSESGSGHGLPALTPPSSAVTDVPALRQAEVVNGNSGGAAPLDFSTPTSSSSSSEDQQAGLVDPPISMVDPPINLVDPPPQRLHLPVTVSAAAAALLGALHPNVPEELRRKYPLAAKPPLTHAHTHPALPLPHTHSHGLHTHGAHASSTHTHVAELRLDRDSREPPGGKVKHTKSLQLTCISAEPARRPMFLFLVCPSRPPTALAGATTA